MKTCIVIFFLLLFAAEDASSQGLPQHVRDSLVAVVCRLDSVYTFYNSKTYQDSLANALKRHDQFLITELEQPYYKARLDGIRTLEGVIKKYGFPSTKLIGPAKRSEQPCLLTGILVTWAQHFPDWFNSPEMVALFKRELDNGNLRLLLIDNAHFFYMRFDVPDIKHKEMINNARLTYGLVPYTDNQFLTNEWIEPIRE